MNWLFEFYCITLVCSEINDSLVTVKNEKTFYDVKATANVSALVEPKEFSCQIDIPEANYTARKEAIYYPGEYNNNNNDTT